MNNFNHQKSIGIIGGSPDSQAFILEANKLGFTTNLLCQSEEQAAQIFGTTKTIIGDLKDRAIREEILMSSDLLVYYDETLSAANVEDYQRTVVIPQGEDLLSIVQDRVLQNAFLDSLSINIAPYKTIVKPEDITQGIKSIGYPAVLRTNQTNPDGQNQTYFIYDENDIKDASTLLKYGTCVLESWVVSEKELSLTAVKADNEEITLFPIVKKEYRNDRLTNIQFHTDLDEELIKEINKVAYIVLDRIEFKGVVTIDFSVTPANALYLDAIYPYPNILSRFTERCNLSASQAHLRAVTSLPLPEEVVIEKPFVFVPFYMDQTHIIDELITIQPNWEFTFYSVANREGMITEEAIGHLVIETDNPSKTLKFLKQKGI